MKKNRFNMREKKLRIFYNRRNKLQTKFSKLAILIYQQLVHFQSIIIFIIIFLK